MILEVFSNLNDSMILFSSYSTFTESQLKFEVLNEIFAFQGEVAPWFCCFWLLQTTSNSHLPTLR